MSEKTKKWVEIRFEDVAMRMNVRAIRKDSILVEGAVTAYSMARIEVEDFPLYLMDNWRLYTEKRIYNIPTVPGAYLDALGSPWLLDSEGVWKRTGSASAYSEDRYDDVEARGPFTKLVPEEN